MAITKADQVKVILENVKPVVTGHTVQVRNLADVGMLIGILIVIDIHLIL